MHIYLLTNMRRSMTLLTRLPHSCLTKEQGKIYATVVEKLGYFIRQRNPGKVQSAKQEEGEPVDDFIMDLCCLLLYDVGGFL